MEEPTRWLDEREMAAWKPFVVSAMHLMAQLERDLKKAFDVTLLDHGILLMLRHSKAGLTMGHLADQFGTEASVITYRLARLEKRGFAQRLRSEKDSREVHARITPFGEELCDHMGPVHITSVRNHFIDHVPRKDLPAIADAFEKLYEAQRNGEV